MSIFKTPNQSFRWLLAELSIVVLGILIAFWVSAWWEGVNLSRWEETQLEALRYEFDQNFQLLELTGQQHWRRAVAIENVLDFADSNEIGSSREFPIAELAAIIAWRTSDIATGALDALLASGDLGNIQNDELRRVLAQWPAAVEDAKEDENLAKEFIEFELSPRLAEQGFLVQAYEQRLASLDAALNEIPQLPDGKMATVVVSSNLAGLLAARLAQQKLAAISIGNLQRGTAAIIEMLDRELAN